MDAIECLKTRRCVRSFTDKIVSDEDIKEIIDCARLAPSAHNNQLWEFIVVKDKKKLAKLTELCTYGKFIYQASCCIIVCGKDSKYLLEDGCAASQNVLLAARALGLGGCWVAGWKRDYNVDVKELLGIPDDIAIVSYLPIGYTEENPEPRNKRTDVIHWDSF